MRPIDLMGLLSQQQPNGDWVTPLVDGLGNVRAVVDENLDVLETRHYGPYGVPHDFQGTPQTPYGFTGEMTDPNDLVYLRERYYDPALGVFPSPDPLPGNIQEAMSLNPYMYVQGNPVNNVDPSGMIAETPEMWGQCRQTSDPCSECIQNYLNNPNNVPPQTDRVFWGPYYYAAWLSCRDLCPSWYGTPPEAAWRLPMDNAALTGDGCLSRRVTSTYVPCSRDMNPRDQSGAGYSVYAPNPNGIVWYAGAGGTGLGNVVILRYNVADLPPHIQSLLPPMPQGPSGGASLFIQYAHLNSDNVSSGDPVPEGLEVGLSGATGGSYAPHLDVTVIWLPDEAAKAALGTHFASPNSAQDWDTLTTNNNAYNARWTIDPLALWPEIRWNETSQDVPTTSCQPSEACNTYTP